MTTAQDVIRKAYQTQPHLKLAVNREGNCIGAWSEQQQRFVMVAGRTIFDPPTWVSMPYELLINGKPPVAAADWIPVPNTAEVPS